MFTPSGHRASSTYNSPARRTPLKGLFTDGVWHCNCTPRLPASHFQVKKEGPNTNKWFYTCQERKETSCGFFLWDDVAKGREKGVVINNSRSEIETDSTRGGNVKGDKRTVEGHMKASNEWMADLGGDMREPETPRKAVKTSGFATPGTGSTKAWERNALPTPDTKGEAFFTPASRNKGGMWDGNETATTPTPVRSRDLAGASTSPGSVSTPLNNYDISEEALELLKDQDIDEEIKGELKQMLSRNALRISGIVKGRDIARVALKVKDTKIAELRQRIEGLEMEREMDKTLIRQLKSKDDT